MQGCGSQDGPCCLTINHGYASASCNSGLSCIPSSIGWASKVQYTKLSSSFIAATKDIAVMGTCKKFTAAQCGKAYMPCGKEIGTHSSKLSQPASRINHVLSARHVMTLELSVYCMPEHIAPAMQPAAVAPLATYIAAPAPLYCCNAAAAGVTCPGSPTKCPNGFYCAAEYDAGAGERCVPIPSNAGQAGGPCLPNNLLVSGCTASNKHPPRFLHQDLLARPRITCNMLYIEPPG